jgi:hypothetical protein
MLANLLPQIVKSPLKCLNFRVLATAALRCPKASTLPYFNPLPTTFYHFSPHLKLIAFLVKQNRAFLKIFLGKSAPVFTVKFHRHRLCAFPLRLTTASGPVHGTLLTNTADLWRPQRLARRRALRITFRAPNRISLPLPSVLS